MSGHSKWSTIKHKKAVIDAKRGSAFTKLANAIAVAVKKGGSGDPEFNFSLRLAIEKARSANMPNSNIQRAIDRGLGKGGGKELEEFVLEGYAPGGVALVIEVVTDNRNRIVSQVHTILDKVGGRLGEPGSVLYLFKRRGLIKYVGKINESDSLELIELGADDFEENETDGVIWTELGKESEVAKYLSVHNYYKVEVKQVYVASVKIDPGDKNGLIKDVIERLKDNDDVQEVYANI